MVGGFFSKKNGKMSRVIFWPLLTVAFHPCHPYCTCVLLYHVYRCGHMCALSEITKHTLADDMTFTFVSLGVVQPLDWVYIALYRAQPKDTDACTKSMK